MKVYLNKNEERRLKMGHQWIFSNEIKAVESFAKGNDVAELYSNSGKFLGIGFYNRNSLIAYRHVSDRNEPINMDFFIKRIKESDIKREILKNNRSAYRVVNGESDFLPGLIIDRYNNSFSISIFSKGMENRMQIITEAIINIFNPDIIIARNDSNNRNPEGLPLYNKILYKNSNNNIINNIINLYDIKYIIDIIKGQKTGFYLDQCENHYRLRKYISDSSKVLDLFCNEGGFALNASYSGAYSVTGIDSSSESIKIAKQNNEVNKLNAEFYEYDVFDYINEVINSDNKYNIVILDPPSFTKSKKNINTAVSAYINLNTKALKLLVPNSVLFTFSCSYHISGDIFLNIIRQSSYKANKRIQILETINCSVDHPVLPQMPETAYLKGYVIRA